MSSSAPPTFGQTLADVARKAERGYTPRELARLLRVSPDRVRSWIAAGELGAIDTARHRCSKPRYVILPQHVEEFLRRRSASPAPKPRRRKRTCAVDYYPD
jgi:excisionase family DNA binding protein